MKPELTFRSGTLDYLSRAIWSQFSNSSSSFIYRGYTAAAAANTSAATRREVESDKEGATSDTEKSPVAKAKSLAATGHSTPDEEADASADGEIKRKDKLPGLLTRAMNEMDQKQKALEEENAPVIRSHTDDTPCTDLVLVIHGIGQHLAAQYESFNFIYAANQFRQVLRKQSAESSVSSVMGERRCQVLPVQWRANLNIESGTDEEDARKEENNVFTMADITIGKSIPYVREVTNSVLLDIPLFMSDHRQKMIEAVCQQANRLYRMWIARHPEFEEHGRVHIVGHSVSF